MRMIRRGDLTDAQAVRRGYLLPIVVANRKCKNDDNKHYARGLCIKCYRSVWDKISKGTLLESRAIKLKLILPSNRKE